MKGKSCCSPSSDRGNSGKTRDQAEIKPSSQPSRDALVQLEGGTFLMGAEDDQIWEADGEAPVREIRLDPFLISASAVTNDEFGRFIDDSEYETEAEKYGWSFVFYNQIPPKRRKQLHFETVAGLEWWARVDGATWKNPGGPGTDIVGKGDHPVTHVSWNDASAYTKWAGLRLPTEAEWEFAARGGLEQKLYPWGDELTPGGRHHCNIWQGKFPENDTGEDGYTSTAPAESFPPNGFGLYNTSGNVWEWTADRFSSSWHLHAARENPTGPPTGGNRVIRGGSFLCHDSYCNRYRVSARSRNTPETSTCHTGFRCAL